MKLLFRLLLIGFSLSLWAADSAAGADVLNRWVGGKWVGSGQFVDSAYSQANNATLRPNARGRPTTSSSSAIRTSFLAASPCANLSIYTFAPKTGKYYFYGISLGEEKARNTALEITDNGERWVYSSTNEIKGKRCSSGPQSVSR